MSVVSAVSRWKFSRSKRRVGTTSPCESAVLDLRVESLEVRRLLAGDVSVHINGDNVVIRGDRADNQIEVVFSDLGGLIVIPENGTTVEGSSNPFETGVRDVNNLTIKMVGGNDAVNVEGVEDLGFIGNNLHVSMGTGEDFLTISELSVGNNLYANTGSDADSLVMNILFVDGNLIVKTGSGEDDISIGDIANAIACVGPCVEVDGHASIHTGGARDEVRLFDVDFDSNFTMSTCGGDDSIELEDVVFGGHTNIHTGGGADNGSAQNIIANGNVNVSMGGGEDFLLVGEIELNGGHNSIRMGGGNDELNIDPDLVSGSFERLTLHGNGGNSDVLDALGLIEFFPSNVEVKSFETIL